MDFLAILSNPWVIVLICVAFGFPLVTWAFRLFKKKFITPKKKKGNMDAQHVRDVVKKFDEKNSK